MAQRSTWGWWDGWGVRVCERLCLRGACTCACCARSHGKPQGVVSGRAQEGSEKGGAEGGEEGRADDVRGDGRGLEGFSWASGSRARDHACCLGLRCRCGLGDRLYVRSRHPASMPLSFKSSTNGRCASEGPAKRPTAAGGDGAPGLSTKSGSEICLELPHQLDPWPTTDKRSHVAGVGGGGVRGVWWWGGAGAGRERRRRPPRRRRRRARDPRAPPASSPGGFVVAPAHSAHAPSLTAPCRALPGGCRCACWP